MQSMDAAVLDHHGMHGGADMRCAMQSMDAAVLDHHGMHGGADMRGTMQSMDGRGVTAAPPPLTVCSSRCRSCP